LFQAVNDEDYSFPARENHDLKVVDESARFLRLPLK
jgi:hypothetical protein